MRYTLRWYSDGRPSGSRACCDGCGPRSAAARSRSWRAIWTTRCGCPAIRWRSRRRSARASTCSRRASARRWASRSSARTWRGSRVSASSSKACCARCRVRAAPSRSARPAASISTSRRTVMRSRATGSASATCRMSSRRRSGACRSRPRSPGALAIPSTCATRPTPRPTRMRCAAFSCRCGRPGRWRSRRRQCGCRRERARPAAWSHRVPAAGRGMGTMGRRRTSGMRSAAARRRASRRGRWAASSASPDCGPLAAAGSAVPLGRARRRAGQRARR